MGSGASLSELPETLSASDCSSLMGGHFDQFLFDSVAVGGAVSKEKFLEALSLRTDCFLTHDWGHELGVDNHARVSLINDALKARGLKTWFDEEQMQGNVKKQMVNGINYAQCVVVFVTRRYVDKVKGDNTEDNCQLEFNYAAMRKTAANMVAAVMEDRMRNPKSWGGEVAMVLGGRLYVDCAGDFNDEACFAESMDNLYQAIVKIIGTPIGSSAVEIPAAPAAKGNELRPIGAALQVGGDSIAGSGDCRPLQSLSEEDCAALLESLNLEDCVKRFRANHVTGEMLQFCESAEEVKELGVQIMAKAKLFFSRLAEFKTRGVPVAYLYEANEARKAAEKQRLEEEKALKASEKAALLAAKKQIAQDEIQARRAAAVERLQLEKQATAALSEKISELAASGVHWTTVHSHQLSASARTTSWSCDGAKLPGRCRHRRERRVRFRCSEGCDFDLCGACMMEYRADSRDSNLIEKGGANAPSPSDDHKSNFVSIHPHELTISDSDNGWACDGKNTEEGCLSGITDFHQTDGMTRYTCNSCDFDLCSACFDAYRSRHAHTATA